MPKRNFPFDGTSPLQLKTHINAFYFEKLNDMDKIYERTRELMQKGSKRMQQEEAEKKRSTNVQTDQPAKCLSCLQFKRFGISCVFCERQLCVDCSHQCSTCAESFCNLCSIANYDERCEKYFCLGCTEHKC